MATEYVQKHKLGGTIEKALAEALASQPENPYEALAAWFSAQGGAAKAASAAKAAKPQEDFGTGEKEAGEANGYGTVAVDLVVRPRPPPAPPPPRCHACSVSLLCLPALMARAVAHRRRSARSRR